MKVAASRFSLDSPRRIRSEFVLRLLTESVRSLRQSRARCWSASPSLLLVCVCTPPVVVPLKNASSIAVSPVTSSAWWNGRKQRARRRRITTPVRSLRTDRTTGNTSAGATRMNTCVGVSCTCCFWLRCTRLTHSVRSLVHCPDRDRTAFPSLVLVCPQPETWHAPFPSD